MRVYEKNFNTVHYRVIRKFGWNDYKYSFVLDLCTKGRISRSNLIALKRKKQTILIISIKKDLIIN